MTNVSASTGFEFRIGAVFSRAFGVLGLNFPMFFLVSMAVSVFHLAAIFQNPASPGGGLVAVTGILFLILNPIGQAVILYGAFQTLRGRSFSFGEAFSGGLARFFPIIGMAILQTIAVGFAMLLLLVPGIILLVRWGAALPACVVEERGPIESLSRSWHLTKGYGWSIFGIMATS